MRNIIVTGANKGIGYGIVGKLAQKKTWNVIMACRNLQLAKKSHDTLKTQYPDSQIDIEHLDITKEESIKQFKVSIAAKYKQVDVVLNNAGVNVPKQQCNLQEFNYIFLTNYYGTINFTQHILPVVKRAGKVIFVSGLVGKLGFVKNQQLKNKFRDQHLTQQKLNILMQQFKDSVVNGTTVKDGWPKSAYTISKLGINFYAELLGQRREVVNKEIQVYSMCPGFTKTDMTGQKGIQTVEKATQTPIYLSEIPFFLDPKIQGRFFEKSKLSSFK